MRVAYCLRRDSAKLPRSSCVSNEMPTRLKLNLFELGWKISIDEKSYLVFLKFSFASCSAFGSRRRSTHVLAMALAAIKVFA